MGCLLYRFRFCVLSTSHDMRSTNKSEASIMRLALLFLICRVRGTSVTSSSRSVFRGNSTDSDLVRTWFRVAPLCFPCP